MVKVRISGSKDSTDVFNSIIQSLVSNNNLICKTNGKEYPNTDFTLRRYFDLDLSNMSGDLQPSKDKFLISTRITGSEDEVNQMLDILQQLGTVYYVPDKNGDFRMKKRDKDYSVMVSCIDRHNGAKRKLLCGDNSNILTL